MLRRSLIVFMFFWMSNGEHPAVEYDIEYFRQRVDHYSYALDDYFDHRYLVSDRYWDRKGPIFFYCGGEASVTHYVAKQGIMWELAPKFNALLVFAEHRYYGTSLPYGNNTFDNHTTMGYLTIHQALGDFASIIYHLKKTVPDAKKCKLIAFGGSYPGMLAAWIRLKFPHLVNGAIAASAPILMFASETPCEAFSVAVTKNFHLANPQCSKSIKRSWQAIRNIGKSDSGVKWLQSIFKSCHEFKSSDVKRLMSWLAMTWDELAMNNYPYFTNDSKPRPANPVNEACKYLKNSAEPDKILVSNIYKAANVFYNYSGSEECNKIPVKGVKSFDPSTHAWGYQTCSEMIMPKCRSGDTDMFEKTTWNLTSHSNGCFRKYGVKADPYKTRIMFGGKDLKGASNIVFSNGDLDPWYPGGILESLSPTLVTYIMDGAAHHLDLRFTNDADPPSVAHVRKLEEHWIRHWLRK